MIDKVLICRAVHDLKGGPVNLSPLNYSNKKKDNHYIINAHLVDKYFSKDINKFPFGIGPMVAAFEIATAGLLVYLFKSASTWVNFLTSLGEGAQTVVAGDLLKRTKLNEHKNDFMASLQVFAGVGGIFKFLTEKLFHKPEELHEVSFLGKIGLSLSSAFSSVMMFFGSGEKTLMSTVSNGHGSDFKSMSLNGHSDTRCAVEWGLMTLVPWVSKIEAGRGAIDIWIIYNALKEGFEHFVEEGRLKSKPLLNKILKRFVDPLSLFKNERHECDDHIHGKGIVFPFNKMINWFLGNGNNSGFRTRFMLPLLEKLGYNLPKCYLDTDGNIVTEHYENGESGIKTALKTRDVSLKSDFDKETRIAVG